MRVKRGGLLASLVAAAAGAGITILIATAGAGAANTVTLGSTTGSPTGNICPASINCTYVPYLNGTPALQVPLDGTVTSFSVNAGSTGGKVELRVLRPAGGGRFKGAGTSPAETITNTGGQTFHLSSPLPVKAGDVLGLDNSSSAIMFDTSSPSAVTHYYELPSLADGSTAAPNRTQNGYRLLLSATVQSSGPPHITKATQSHRTWREGGKLPVIARKRRPPVGTTYSVTLNQTAQVLFTFTQQLPGRRVKGKCVPPTKRNRHNPRCTRTVIRGTLSFPGHAGTNKVFFQGRLSNGRRLKLGAYTLVITATNAAGQRSNRASLRFTIVR